MRIIFVRHGHPDYTNDCLTELGHLQAGASWQNDVLFVCPCVLYVYKRLAKSSNSMKKYLLYNAFSKTKNDVFDDMILLHKKDCFTRLSHISICFKTL